MKRNDALSMESSKKDYSAYSISVSITVSAVAGVSATYLQNGAGPQGYVVNAGEVSK